MSLFARIHHWKRQHRRLDDYLNPGDTQFPFDESSNGAIDSSLLTGH